MELDENGRRRYDSDYECEYEQPKCKWFRLRSKYIPMVSEQEWLYEYRKYYGDEQGRRSNDHYDGQPNGVQQYDELAGGSRECRQYRSLECNDGLGSHYWRKFECDQHGKWFEQRNKHD